MPATFLKWTLFGALAALLLATVALVVVVQPTPIVTEQTPPSPTDVQQAKRFVRGVRLALNTQTGEPAPFTTDLAALNGTLKLGARLIPGFRGQMEPSFDEVIGHASIPVPFTGRGQWLNVTLAAPSFEGDFKLSRAQVGPIQLPPGITLAVLRTGANLQDWPALRARVQTERDVIVSYDGIPQIMSEADFNRTYGDIDDPRYLAMLNQIERKVDQLSLHQ